MLWSLNSSITILNNVSKHLSCQMMKFVYLFSKTSLSVLNMLYKHDAATQDIRVLSFHLHTTRSKYRSETLLAPSALAP